MKHKLCLENLKPGDEVVSVRYVDKTTVVGPVRVVIGFQGERWRYADPKTPHKVAGAFPVDGGCCRFMSKSRTPDFYFSANPKHVETSRRRHARLQIKRSKAEAKASAKFDRFMRELKALMLRHGAAVYPELTAGDDQGVEMEVRFEAYGRVYVAPK